MARGFQKQGAVLLAAATLFLAASAVAEQNITEVKIEDIPVIVEAGTRLDFSFLVGNRVGNACNAQIDYWIGEHSLKESQGSDTAYLGPGDVETGQASVLVPSNMHGVQNFYLEMQCNDTIVLANKTIEVKQTIPTMPLFTALDIEEEEGQQFEFSYGIKSNYEGTAAVHVEERLVKDGNVVWVNAQNIPVLGSAEIKRFGPVLQPGNYKLILEASHGTEKAEMAREFSVKAAAPSLPMQLSLLSSLGILLGLGIATTATVAGFNRLRKKPGFALLLRRGLAKPAAIAAGNKLCLVESEASGMLDDKALDRLLDEANYSEEEKAKVFEVATSVPVIQIVKSCVFTEGNKKRSFETLVSMTVVNNSNRDWDKVIVLCRTPPFFGEKVSEVASDTKMRASEEDSIITFELDKVCAKQSASIVYSVPKLISQGEAERVSLPAVTGYEEGKRLVVKKAKIKRKRRKAVKKAVSRKRGQRKAEG